MSEHHGRVYMLPEASFPSCEPLGLTPYLAPASQACEYIMREVSSERRLTVHGAFNFRDLGGYATSDGRHVKAAMLYRSGTMAKVSGTAAAQMRALGIRSIVDFRRQHECASQPTSWHIGSDVQYWACGHDILSGELAELARNEATTAAAMRAAMIALYRELPHRHAESYRHMFGRLMKGDLPLLFNCAAGKDRTGVAAALILHSLGVPTETIRADYLLTNEADFSGLIEAGSRYDTLAPSVRERLFAADPDYLDAMYAELTDRFGGIDAYIVQVLGVDITHCAKLRDILLE